jgi:hypothetical protein
VIPAGPPSAIGKRITDLRPRRVAGPTFAAHPERVHEAAALDRLVTHSVVHAGLPERA